MRTINHKIKYNIGALVDLLSFTAFWLSIVNFVMIGLTAYNTTIREPIVKVLPWFNLWWFFGMMGLIVMVIMLLEYLIIYPARQHFRNQWEYRQDSPIRKDLEEIKRELKELRRLKNK